MKRASRLAAIPALMGVLLVGCVPISGIKPQSIAVQSQGLGLGAETAPAIDARWWEAMADPQLDRLMDAALADNPTLDAAMARLRGAQAVLAEQDAARLPQIDADASLLRDRLSGEYEIPPPFAGTTRWIATAQANISWNLDFWGRQSALIRQAGASRDAVGYDLAAARLALAGSVAQTYVDLLRGWQLVDIAQEFVASRQHGLALVRVRMRNKLASGFDENAAVTLLAQARQAEVRAERDRAVAVHALAALIGRGADFYPEIKRPTFALDHALPLPETLPADLLGRRPDLLAAQARIESASAGRKVARTAFYPNIDLRGLIGLQAVGLGAFFTANARTYGAGPAIHLPIFEGGRLRAEYAGATATLDGAVAKYNDAVLGAVRDVADALTKVDAARADAAEQEQALLGLSRTVHLNEVRMRTGLGSQLDILDSNDRLLAARQARVGIATEAAIRRIQLLIAVGGGFDPASTPTTETRSKASS